MNTNYLAIKRTKLANQRTYLAYMRTGFAIAAIAGSFKKMWIVIFGLFMIIISSFQYFVINHNLDSDEITNDNFLDLIPISYLILSIGALYLQFKK